MVGNRVQAFVDRTERCIPDDGLARHITRFSTKHWNGLRELWESIRDNLPRLGLLTDDEVATLDGVLEEPQKVSFARRYVAVLGVYNVTILWLMFYPEGGWRLGATPEETVDFESGLERAHRDGISGDLFKTLSRMVRNARIGIE